MKQLRIMVLSCFIACALFFSQSITTVRALPDATITLQILPTDEFLYTKIFSYVRTNYVPIRPTPTLQAQYPEFYPSMDQWLLFWTSSYTYNFLVVNQSNFALIYGKADIDEPRYQDIDAWYMYYGCSVALPCKIYRFNSSGVYQNTVTYTGAQIFEITTGSANKPYMTNFRQKTESMYYDPYCDVNCNVYENMTTGTEDIRNLIPYNGQSFWYGSSDDESTQELIDANWGMFNFLKDFLNWGFNAILDVISGISDVIVAGIGMLFQPSDTALSNFTTASNKLSGAVPCWGQVEGFWVNLTASGTQFPPITGEVFGENISFDLKTMVFDPFLPIAPTFQLVFKFTLWLGFARKIWKESQNLINGGGSTDGGSA